MKKLYPFIILFAITCPIYFHALAQTDGIDLEITDLEITHIDDMGIYIPSQIVYLEKEYNTVNELMGPFEGGMVYVSIWATWCKPCLVGTVIS